ncbi:hypothetical protein TSUD_208080 [Trifolium subterraneum]|uniref:IBB domain-containing protein n=1 Tax=Trifolium subterraneum TaxID=3900 RepID=A0A2Z6MU57_TRISU|nr:hypothetical protein TSUD_208080 [Trifolium subterraneum]
MGPDDKSQQLKALIQFQKFQELLSIEGSPPAEKVIERFIQCGAVPRFVKFLSMHDIPQIQYMAAWVLAYIASGTSKNIEVVIDHGAVPIFIKLLSSPSDPVREQAAWALGNVASDSPRYRDLVLSHGALIPLLSQLNEQAKLSTQRDAMWTLLNFLKGKPQPQFEQVKPVLPALQRLLFSDDEEVLTETCWALSFLSDGPSDKIQAVIDAGVCGRLVQLLLHPSPSVLIPALRTVGNIVTGDHMQTQAVIEVGLIASLVNLFQNAEFDIKKEVVWAFYNASSGGTNEQIKYLVSQSCIKPLCDLLVCHDPKIVTICLDGLANFLKVGKAEKSFGNTGDDGSETIIF